MTRVLYFIIFVRCVLGFAQSQAGGQELPAILVNSADRLAIVRLGRPAAEPAVTEGLKGRGRAVAFSPNQKVLLRCYDLPEVEDRPSGRIEAFRIGSDDSLEPLGQAATGGATPCSMAVHPSGRFVAVAHFRAFGRNGGPGAESRGSVSIHPVGDDGVPRDAAQRMEYDGTSVHPTRQSNSHPHMVRFHPSGKWMLVADLGIDRIHVHRVIEATGEVQPAVHSVQAPPGTGPRHFVFHAAGRHFYVITEMSNEVLHYQFTPETGEAQLKTRITARTADGRGGAGADIVSDPAGRWLCASLRKNSLLALFSLDEANATPSRPSHLALRKEDTGAFWSGLL